MICEVEFCVTRIFHQASDSFSIPFYVLDPFVLDCVGQAAEKINWSFIRRDNT
jgi:hypothetical protein